MAFLAALIPAGIAAVTSALGTHAKNTQTDKAITGYTNAENQAVKGYGDYLATTRGDYAPYQAAGTSALSNLTRLTTPGSILDATMADPSYNWRFGEGVRAVDSSVSAKGTRDSGGTLRALTRYGQGAASQEYQNIFDRNATLAGYGMHANDVNAQAGATAANGTAESVFAGARGRASGYGVKGDTNQAAWGSANGILNNAWNTTPWGGGGNSSGGGYPQVPY